QLLAQETVLQAEFVRIAAVQLGALVEFRVAQPRGVRTQAADAALPAVPAPQYAMEVRGVGAVEHVIGCVTAGLVIRMPDRVAECFPGRQAPVRFYGERHDDGDARLARGVHD